MSPSKSKSSSCIDKSSRAIDSQVHPWVLRELVDEVGKPLSIITEKSCQSSEVPLDWKRGNITLSFKKG